MSERLSNLKQQKQLIEGHLRWLELEIANESGQSVAKPDASSPLESLEGFEETIPFPAVDTPAVALETEVGEEVEVDELAEQIISQYSEFTASKEMDPRLSLALFFGSILGFMGLVIFLFYWFGYR